MDNENPEMRWTHTIARDFRYHRTSSKDRVLTKKVQLPSSHVECNGLIHSPSIQETTAGSIQGGSWFKNSYDLQYSLITSLS